MTDHNYLFVGVSCMLFSFGIVAKAYAKFNISYEQGFVAAINEANFKNFKYYLQKLIANNVSIKFIKCGDQSLIYHLAVQISQMIIFQEADEKYQEDFGMSDYEEDGDSYLVKAGTYCVMLEVLLPYFDPRDYKAIISTLAQHQRFSVIDDLLKKIQNISLKPKLL